MNSSSKTVAKKPLYNSMNGIFYSAMFSPKCFKEALNYKAQPEDIFLVTYPKCGTTWMQHVLLYIFRKGRELEDMGEFRKLCPFMDFLGLEGIQKMPRPGAIKTHLPFTYLQLSEKAKYIFVARNPKDCCVSFYHHAKNHPGFGYWDGKFNDFFELFINGEVEYNDYFNHLLSWYPHRHNSNVFYTTYEDMKIDIQNVVIKLASFLGKEYINTIEKDNSVLTNIIKYSSFEYLREGTNNFWKERNVSVKDYEGMKYLEQFVTNLNVPENLPPSNFLRKGIVGDWKNVLSEEQNARMDERIFQRLQKTDIVNWFL